MTEVEESKADVRGPQVLPLSVKAYHALGEMGLIPKQTELLYGQVFHKMSKSPCTVFSPCGSSGCCRPWSRLGVFVGQNNRSPVRTQSPNPTSQWSGDARRTSTGTIPAPPSLSSRFV